ncbi:MAG: TrmB family transcriptional regulator [Promethearchaeota archaeon]|nr:MAG: TrmB family transcriptional regulator [Candidatus Lokiarchaeota archaeon]
MSLIVSVEDESKKYDENDIEEGLQLLGFTKNDSKVLLTLSKFKILSPADIARYSGVDRARVYDSLNRLIERGFIQKEPVKRGANYQIIPIEKIFKSIREEYKQRIEESLIIEKALGELEIEVEDSGPSVWAINERDKIRKKMKDLISNAKTRIFFIITPDLLMEELGGFEWLLKEIWNKKFSSDIQIVLALKYFEALKEEIKKLLKLSVKIHSIEGDSVIPFGLLITDNEFLLTTLDQVKEAPEYTSGLWMENGTRNQVIGYEHLFRHFISSETKEIQLTRKVPYQS